MTENNSDLRLGQELAKFLVQMFQDRLNLESESVHALVVAADPSVQAAMLPQGLIPSSKTNLTVALVATERFADEASKPTRRLIEELRTVSSRGNPETVARTVAAVIHSAQSDCARLLIEDAPKMHLPVAGDNRRLLIVVWTEAEMVTQASELVQMMRQQQPGAQILVIGPDRGDGQRSPVFMNLVAHGFANGSFQFPTKDASKFLSSFISSLIAMWPEGPLAH